MPNIKPVSDLRNYSEVLKDVAMNEPVFLTRNGRAKYVILAIEEYDRTRSTLQLLKKLNSAEAAAEKPGALLEVGRVEEILGV